MTKAQIVAQEVSVLRSWSDKSGDGSTIPGVAFGNGCRVDMGLWISERLKSKDYDFYIEQDGDRLSLVVDAYTASGRAEQAGEAWDVDQWDAEKIYFSANFSRGGFHDLSSIGRTLVAGRDVVLRDGLVVFGGHQVGGRHA